MKSKLNEHISGILFVAAIFLIVYFLLIENKQEVDQNRLRELKTLAGLQHIDYEDPLHRAIFKDTYRLFSGENADSLLAQIDLYRKQQFSQLQAANKFDLSQLLKLMSMFIKFILIYVIVLLLTYYGVQTAAIVKFVRYKQNKPPLLKRAYLQLKGIKSGDKTVSILTKIYRSAKLFCLALVKSLIYSVLFSPAYVIAYSIKTRFDTNSVLFMILLAIISNSLLITYTQRFFSFLISENRKGYTQTAVVKNLNNCYSIQSLGLLNILKISKFFHGHVFQHIFLNARHQFIPTIKEQAAFLITGLIIIEMALNIHGHLFYELLQNLLYKNYISVLVILFAIFVVVKTTAVFVDYWNFRENSKYANR